jgi:integrase
VPWICAYTGARVNEITQLRAEDVFTLKVPSGERVWVIRITPEAGTVKNRKARNVSIHPYLLEQGFLEFVNKRDGKHLFYDPARRRGGSPANPQYKKVGERLARWVRKEVGITDTGIDPNHAWRHLFRSWLIAAKVHEQVIDQVEGHVPKKVSRTYGSAWPAVMLEAVSVIPPYLAAEGSSSPARRHALSRNVGESAPTNLHHPEP